MADLNEIIIVSDASGQMWNTSVWNPKTGTVLMHYKAGSAVAQRNGVCILNGDYILSADSQKPLIHVWPLNSQERCPQIRLVAPGVVNALAVSPDGNYCAAAVDEKIFIWQVASGRLLSTLNRHYQKVNCLKFTDTGTHFISGGDDGMVMVWCLATVVTLKTGDLFYQKEAGKIDPEMIFSEHSLPVTDIAIGHGGLSRFISVSLDRTCNVYDFRTREVLLSIVFEEKLTAVTTNWIEDLIFVGCENGNVFEFSIRNPPRNKEYHTDQENRKQVFKEHDKRIVSLSVSMDNETLLSSSEDNRVIVWNIPSRTYLRITTHKGPITNAFFTTAYKNIFADNFQPQIVLHSFQRSIDEKEPPPVEILHVDNDYLTPVDTFSSDGMTVKQSVLTNSSSTKREEYLRKELDTLATLNRDLYRSAMHNLVQKHVINKSNAVALKSGGFAKKRRRL